MFTLYPSPILAVAILPNDDRSFAVRGKINGGFHPQRLQPVSLNLPCRTLRRPCWMTSHAVTTSMFRTFTLVCFVVGAAFSTCCLWVFAMDSEVTVSVTVIALPDLQLWCIHFCVVIFRVDKEPEFDASVGGFWIVCEDDDGLMGGTISSWFAAEWFDFRDVDTSVCFCPCIQSCCLCVFVFKFCEDFR
jgi:hypothetical protein